jgi:putative transposase
VFEANFRVYGVRKVWRQLQREGFVVARRTVARLMRALGLEGIIRGKPIRTTVSDKAVPCPLDHVNRQFHAPAPNMLWVSDFTYVATWTGGPCMEAGSCTTAIEAAQADSSGRRNTIFVG